VVLPELATGHYVLIALTGGTLIYTIWFCFLSRALREYEAAILRERRLF